MRVIQQGSWLVRGQLPLTSIPYYLAKNDFRFFLSPGRLHVEMCIDKAIVYYGEKLDLQVVINNFSNKTIRKIECQLIQVLVLLFVGEIRRTPFSCLKSNLGFPMSPGASVCKVFLNYPFCQLF